MKLSILLILFFNLSFSQIPPGNGMVFNGTSDYYSVPDNSSVDFNGSFTIEAWINPCDTVGGMIVAKQWCSGGQFSYYFTIFNGKLRWYWNSNSGCGGVTGSYYESRATILNNNIWQHVAVVHTATSISMYYNGILVSGNLVACSYGQIYNSNSPLRIGVYRALAGSYFGFFNGRMDEIRMWNTALSPSQISSRYNSPLSGSESNLQLYHNFESVSGATINNSSTATGILNNGLNVNGSATIIPNSYTNCDSVIVKPEPGIPCSQKLIMPNVFSPNEDGVNDVFLPIGYDCYKLLSFRVYNRWGQIVFESFSEIKWNGKFNTKVVSEGVYFWVVEHENNLEEIELEKGIVSIF